MATGFLLLHSPLVGRGTWLPVASALRARGHAALIPDLRLADLSPPWHLALETRIAETARGADRLIAVGHSGAGTLIPAALAKGWADGAIFVDALLPHPGQTWLETAPPGLAGHLEGLAVEGVLPRWSDWLPPGTLERLLPDAEGREAFLADLDPLPIGYFREIAPAWPEPEPARAAYLRLSAAYEAEEQAAAGRGWSTRSMASHHLAMLTDADAIAEILIEMAQGLVEQDRDCR